MLSSRHVHVLFLGLILGAATAYVYASVQEGSRRMVLAEEALANLRAGGGETETHPEITDQDMLTLFEEALVASPDDPELLTRYATFLFELRRFEDAAATFDRLLLHAPDDAEIRTYLATALYAAGERQEAMVEFETALASDPEQILALHNLALGHLDLNGDIEAAGNVLARIQAIDPFYEGIVSILQRINAAGTLE